MKRYNIIKVKNIFLSMISFPLFIAVYILAMYELYTLCRFGRYDNNLNIFILCLVFFFICLVIFITLIIKQQSNYPNELIENFSFTSDYIKLDDYLEIEIDMEDIKSFKINKKYAYIKLKNREIIILSFNNKSEHDVAHFKEILHFKEEKRRKSLMKTVWTWISIVIIIFTTGYYGFKIYRTALNFNGKLSWILFELKNEKNITLTNSNIYETGIEGIFDDISKKVDLPETMYISDTGLSLEFNSKGEIESFYAFIYGKNDKDEVSSFLVNYDINKSNKIRVTLDGYVTPDFNDDKLLEPLFDTMKVIPLKDTVSKWDSNKYGILYYGKRSFGLNTDGIVYIDNEGNTNMPSIATSEVIGYTVSVYVPNREKEITPFRYNLVEDLNNVKSAPLNSVDNTTKKPSSSSNREEPEFYLTDKIGYRLKIVGAAAGSRAYALEVTEDGGSNFEVLNDDPFLGRLGGASGISFINEKLGFIALSHNGGDEADLYRSEDGGLTFTQINIPRKEVALDSGTVIEPFDFPEMPFEDNGVLNMLVGQGADGDYNGNSDALYESMDNGVTWEFIKEVKDN